jgi:hypothetical protein
VLETSARRILERLDDSDLVLDVGGWAKPFPRADWVIDLLPYETRGLYDYERSADERFSAETWVQRDICAHEPWPFADNQFDFVICAQTLEDIRDPVWVCEEMARVAKAGYLETPSRLVEQCYGVQGAWCGWGHHHWLVETSADSVEFVFKHHNIHGRRELQVAFAVQEALTPQERAATLWWEGTFTAGERVFVGPEELFPWLAAVPAAHPAPDPQPQSPPPGRARRLLARFGR